MQGSQNHSSINMNFTFDKMHLTVTVFGLNFNAL